MTRGLPRWHRQAPPAGHAERRSTARAIRLARIAATAALCAGATLVVSGCGSIGAASGAAAGAASGLVTANPAVGIGVGIAVQAATDEAVNRYLREMHGDQQNMIASLVGSMPVGNAKPWRVKHTLPIENGHGEVRVTRAFTSALAICKEFVFSVVDGDDANAPTHWFTGSACLQDKGWKWASAEPAVERWGALQ